MMARGNSGHRRTKYQVWDQRVRRTFWRLTTAPISDDDEVAGCVSADCATDYTLSRLVNGVRADARLALISCT
jgi:hypothetical protein